MAFTRIRARVSGIFTIPKLRPAPANTDGHPTYSIAPAVREDAFAVVFCVSISLLRSLESSRVAIAGRPRNERRRIPDLEVIRRTAQGVLAPRWPRAVGIGAM